VSKRFRYALGGFLGRALLGALFTTVRFRVRNPERFQYFADRGEAVVYALWHGRLLPLTYFHRGRGIAAVISRSADGEYIARLVRGWTFDPIRGSSSRGGREALGEVVRRVQSGQSVAITPDGPRGPRQRLQPGVIRAAQRTGAAILPVVAGCTRAWWPGSWDRFCIPKPFSTVEVWYGQARKVPADATPEEMERLARGLEADMNAMVEQVDRDGGPDR
jgi:lysophospholipid acyltransferase (LPLAT)-like uncharacterized protein